MPRTTKRTRPTVANRDQVETALDLAEDFAKIAKELRKDYKSLLDEYAEAVRTIEVLRATQKAIVEEAFDVVERKEAARRSRSAQHAASAKGKSWKIKMLASRLKNAGVPERSINKSIAIDLKMTPQGVAKARKRPDPPGLTTFAALLKFRDQSER